MKRDTTGPQVDALLTPTSQPHFIGRFFVGSMRGLTPSDASATCRRP